MKARIFTHITVLTLATLIVSCSSNSESNIEEASTALVESEEIAAADCFDSYYQVDEVTDYDLDEEDVDLSAEMTYHTTDGNIIYVSRDAYGNISAHDLNGNYISGYSDQYGNTTLHDLNGNYVYSYTDDYGNTTSHDLNGNYSYSYTDDYGYTTGHDLNGNYYSAYTDDYGYTTITSY